jgi:alpha-mannosidase
MCAIGPQIADALIEYSTSTGMRAMPVLYGVGDHGGGPTRRDLRRIRELNEWPIYPKVCCSTLRRFFRTAEREATQVPEIVGERNFIFPGCYTSQARQKWANRHGENMLYVGELAATIGDLLAGVAYPHEKLDEAWRGVLFQQFHDILPGSGVRETNEYAMGKGQEIQATAGMARTNALRALSARVNTEALRADFVLDDVRTAKDVQESGRTLGAGVGYATGTGGESASSAAQSSDRVFLIFNPLPYARHEVVEVTLWDVELPADQLVVSGLDMEPQPVQVIDEGNYWMHTYKTVAFPVKVPGVGYRAVVVSDRRTEMGLLTERGNPWLGKLGSARLVDAPDVTMENEYLKVRLDPASGAVVSLVDKRNGRQWVPEGERCGVFQYSLERNQGMTAWVIGQFLTQEDLVDGGVLERVHGGPHQETFRWTRKVSRSTLSVDITLRQGVPRLDYRLTVDWREMGDEGTIPNLRVRFPLAVEEPTARFETPFGAVERELFAGEEVPAQRWVDLSEQDGVGITVANRSKYGFSVEGNSLNMTLLRASVDPDPLPDIGEHVIEYALAPHVTGSSVGDMMAVGEQVNQPLLSLSAGFQEGDLAPQGTLLRAADPAQANVRLAAVKESQDSITAQGAPALIVRLYEVEGRATEARWDLNPGLVPDGAEAVEVDTLERPLDVNGARLDGNTLVVTVPAYGITSVRVGV